MNRFFADTMLGQEREDSAAVKSQRLAERAVLSEFANAEQILAAAKERGITAEKFFSSDGGIALPVLPVRTSDKFYIKKHTTSQRPYMHSHDFYEVIFVSRGRLRQTFSQGESLDMCKGECCIIVPPAAHKIERAGAGDIALKMVVPKNIFERCAGDFKDKLFAGGKKVSDGVYLYKNAEPRCAYFIFGLMRECARRTELCEITSKSLLTLFFASLAEGERMEHSAVLAELERYLSAHVKDASLKDFACAMGYSRAYLSRLIAKETGASFSQIYSDYRLKFAAELLSDGDLSVENVAAEAGYAGLSGFYKQFCAYYGMTPAEYRKMFE